ncbi:hypothetical protein K6V92_20985 [Cupriavidus respiraculi]|uniref:hypothetical protein n=1 Tax=Cupriavidus respiraculi TaxID=195930 RepID=UPI001C97313C|nr:hypothetical protein [Cupriavidus respiraculi]MBY4949080.1 hypothetical protein [Cupriavidus respiraculi]
MNGRVPPAVVAGFTTILLAVCAYWFRGEYAYFDDYFFVVDGNIPGPANWMSIGRPGTFLYLKSVTQVLDGNLLAARVLAGLLVAACSLLVYTAMKSRGHSDAVAAAMALSLPAATAVQISIVWINTGSTMPAMILAVLSYWLGTTGWRRFATGTILMGVAALVYQPSACIIFVLYLMDWLLLPRSRPKLSDMLPFVSGGFGLGLSFAVAKASAAFLSPDLKWAGRGALVHDFGQKFATLWDGIWPVVFNPVFPHGIGLGRWPFYGAVLLCGSLAVLRVAQGTTRTVYAYIWSLIVALAYLAAAGVSVLVVQENWPSYRTVVPWSVLAITALGIAVHLFLPRTLSPTVRVVCVCACISAVGALNASTIGRYLVRPEIAAINDFTRQVESGVAAGKKEFGLVLAPSGPFAWQFRTYELGWISASALWPTAGMLVMAEQRLGLPRKSLKFTYVKAEPSTCESCHVIDMRPYWHQLYGRYTVPHLQALERESAANQK